MKKIKGRDKLTFCILGFLNSYNDKKTWAYISLHERKINSFRKIYKINIEYLIDLKTNKILQKKNVAINKLVRYDRHTSGKGHYFHMSAKEVNYPINV